MTLNDSWMLYLKSLGHTGTFNDMLFAELKDQTSADGCLMDLWQKFFIGKGITKGTFNDKLLTYLIGLGYTSGTLNERLKESVDAQDFFSVEEEEGGDG